MSTDDWRNTVAVNLIAYMRGAGITRFSSEEAKPILERLAVQDAKLPQSKRVGYAYIVSNYSESGLTRFMGSVEREWNESMSTVPLQSQPQDGSAHKFECVVSMKLDKDTYFPVDVHKLFQDYFISSLSEPFACAVVQVVRVHACWYDMKVRYSVGLPQIFDLVLAPTWVIDALTKPSSEFGKLGLNQ